MIKGGEAEKCSVECHIHFTNQPLCTNFAEEPNCTSLNNLPLPADPDGRQPLHLTVEDVDRDGHPDLLVQPGEGLVYPYLLDTGKQTFRPPTAAEQGRLALGHPR